MEHPCSQTAQHHLPLFSVIGKNRERQGYVPECDRIIIAKGGRSRISREVGLTWLDCLKFGHQGFDDRQHHDRSGSVAHPHRQEPCREHQTEHESKRIKINDSIND